MDEDVRSADHSFRGKLHPTYFSGDHKSPRTVPEDLLTPPRSLNGQEEGEREPAMALSESFRPRVMDPAKGLLSSPIAFVPASQRTIDDERLVLGKTKFVDNLSSEHAQRKKLIMALPNMQTRRHHSNDDMAGAPRLKKPLGFRNPMNYCYRRSMMQSLVNVPQFGAFLRYHRNLIGSSGCREGCLVCSFRVLYQASNDQESGSIARSVANVDKSIRMLKPSPGAWTRNQEQADSHEFLLAIVRQILEDYEKLPVRPDLDPAALVRGMFMLQSIWSWTCKLPQCHAPSSPRVEEEFGFQLGLGRDDGSTVSLEELIKSSAMDVVEPRCEQCNTKAAQTRWMSIRAAPEILFIQLKRFEPVDMMGRSYKKNKRKVKIPELLDLSRYLESRSSQQQTGKLHYRLNSVVCHSGSLKFGHYVAYVNKFQEKGSPVWEISDEDVRKADHEELTKPRDSSLHPYILTYVACEERLSESSKL